MDISVTMQYFELRFSVRDPDFSDYLFRYYFVQDLKGLNAILTEIFMSRKIWVKSKFHFYLALY